MKTSRPWSAAATVRASLALCNSALAELKACRTFGSAWSSIQSIASSTVRIRMMCSPRMRTGLVNSRCVGLRTMAAPPSKLPIEQAVKLTRQQFSRQFTWQNEDVSDLQRLDTDPARRLDYRVERVDASSARAVTASSIFSVTTINGTLLVGLGRRPAKSLQLSVSRFALRGV